jgi:threonine/homoserine/homoserine lactone efflux protein
VGRAWRGKEREGFAQSKIPIMISLGTAGVFFAASVVLALAPGPDNIFVLTQSVLRGPCAGCLVTLGLCTGLLVHTAVVSLGIAAVIKASPFVFTSIKLLGAGYLLYLALLVFRAGGRTIAFRRSASLSGRQLYTRGIIMNVTNPKVSVFFMAFLPQFAEPQRGPMALQLVSLGGLFILATVVVFGSVALLAGSLGDWLVRSERAQRFMNWVAGTIFLGIAVHLAVG